MSKKVGIGIAAAAVVVVAGALGTSYYMGGKLEQEFTANLPKLNMNGVTVKVVSYERGAFSSTAKTSWTMEGADEPVQFMADHRISHGPLPMGHAAQIHTSFQLPADADEALKTALNGRSPLEVDTKLGWGRSSSSVMTSPAVTARMKDSDVNWGGMKVEWEMPADMKAAKGTAQFAALHFKDEEGSAGMDKAQMRFDIKQPEGQKFWIGPFAMTIDKFSALKQEEEGKTSASSFEGISMDSDTKLNGDVVEMTLKSGIKSIKLEDTKADDLLLDVSFHNLDASWINNVIDMSKRKSASTDEGEAPEDLEPDLREKLMNSLTQALARKPSIDINRVSMRTEDGVSEFGASLSYIGDGQKMGNLLKDVKLSLKADVPSKAMDAFLVSRKKNALLSVFEDESEYKPEEIEETAKLQAQASVQALKDKGILLEKDGKLNTQIVYANGEIQVNGKALDDTGTAVLMGEALE